MKNQMELMRLKINLPQVKRIGKRCDKNAIDVYRKMIRAYNHTYASGINPTQIEYLVVNFKSILTELIILTNQGKYDTNNNIFRFAQLALENLRRIDRKIKSPDWDVSKSNKPQNELT
jgi:hypothetical protein